MSLLLTAKIYEAVVNPATDWTICQEHYKKSAFSWEGFLQLTWSILLALPLIGRGLNTLEYQYAIKHYRKPETETQVKTDRVSKEIVGELKPTKETDTTAPINKQQPIEVKKDLEQRDASQTSVEEEKKPTDEAIIPKKSTTQTPPLKENEKIQPSEDKPVPSDPDFIARKQSALEYYEMNKKYQQEGMQYYAYSYSNYIKRVDKDLQDDRDVALAAVGSAGENLQYLSERLKKDREIVKLAVSKWGGAIEYVNDEKLLDDIEIIKLAVSQRYADALQHPAIEKHRENREIVLLAVSYDGTALRHAPKFQDDRELVLKAIADDPSAYRYASQKVKDDIEVIKAAISKKGSLLEDVSQQFKENDEIVLMALSNDGEALKYAPKYQDNKDYVLKAVFKKPSAFNYVSPNLKNDKEVVKAVLLQEPHFQDPYLFSEASDALRKDEPFIFEIASELHQINESSPFKATQSQLTKFFDVVNLDLWKKKPFVLKALALCPNALQYVGPDLKKDRDVLITAAAGLKDSYFFKELDKELLKDKEFVLIALASLNDLDAFYAVDEELWKDKDFVLKAMQINGRCLFWLRHKFGAMIDDAEVITAAKNSIINELKKLKMSLKDPNVTDKQKGENAELLEAEIKEFRRRNEGFAVKKPSLAFADEIEKALIDLPKNQRDVHFHFIKPNKIKADEI